MDIKFEQISNVEFEGVDPNDYPDFSNAFISSCEVNGEQSTEKQLDYINEHFLDSFYDDIYQSLID